jgi:CRP/FNR family transcriptional regulator, cyclic AMP receptor protein
MVRNGTIETRTDPALSGALNSLPVTRENRELLEDPLAYLPCSTIVEYSRGQLIYGRSQTSNNIYLVIDGKVKVCRSADDGRQVVVDIYQPDEFFGECGFLGEKHRVEEAVALDATKVMIWSTAEIEELVVRRPRLGIALVQLLVRRSMDFGARIESFSIDNIGRRLVRSLIRFSERLGKETGDGSVEMMAFTHELLSQYVGTSREIVTHYMNQLRRQGYLRYSRKGITLNREALREWLQRDASAHSE